MLRGGEIVPDVRKIAVVRANGLGDLMFAMPALYSLKAAYPEAEIVLLGKRWHHDFLTGRPGPVDRVEIVPLYPGVSAPEDATPEEAAADAFFDRMQAEHFDIALQMHGGGRNSNPFTRRLGAKLAAGTKTPDAAPLERTMPYIYFQSETLRCLEIAGLVGAEPVLLEPLIELTAADLAEVSAVVPDDAPGAAPPADFVLHAAPIGNGVAPSAPLAVIHPGVGAPDRQWPSERFAAVGDALARAGARVVITGSEDERTLAAQMRAAMQEDALDVSGRLSLGGLAALLSRARLMVSNDTGPLHLAEAVGTPTVGIYWCFNLINGGPVSRTKNRPLVSWLIECPLCGRSQVHDPCDHKISYVTDVTPAEVIDQALALWSQFAPEANAPEALVEAVPQDRAATRIDG